MCNYMYLIEYLKHFKIAFIKIYNCIHVDENGKECQFPNKAKLITIFIYVRIR